MSLFCFVFHSSILLRVIEHLACTRLCAEDTVRKKTNMVVHSEGQTSETIKEIAASLQSHETCFLEVQDARRSITGRSNGGHLCNSICHTICAEQEAPWVCTSASMPLIVAFQVC
jgi:hypothetical protein